MAQELLNLLREALALPPEARAALADSLLESLDESADASAEEEWDKEIAGRVADLDAGKVKVVSWSDVRRQMMAIVHAT
jgi:putative addiction module component (TIGR02574 family)